MAPSPHCHASKARWFNKPWDFEQVLQKNLMELSISIPEIGDNGDMEVTGDVSSSDVHNDGAGDDTVEISNMSSNLALNCLTTEHDDVELDLESFESEISQSLLRNAIVEEHHNVLEVRHIMHEMQDTIVPPTFPLALARTINPQVPFPGRSGEFIWKARLVSQLNDNAFLSKDRLQRIKVVGNQYYSEEELNRLRIDPNVKTLAPGHDIAVLFEREEGYGSDTIADSIRSRCDGKPTDVDRKSKGESYFELGRVQMIKRKCEGSSKSKMRFWIWRIQVLVRCGCWHYGILQ
jgi:hypothetical protein